ncbi:MAG: DUF1190 domain-containing protein [Bosea sp. (in: a-proteobacteria)]
MVHLRAMIVLPAVTVILRLAVLAPVLPLVTPHSAAAQSAGPVYERRDECVEAGLLSAEQCEFAYRNARAEYEQRAPRYATRAQCERVHTRCGAQAVTTGGWESLGRGGATYLPRFSGVRIVGTGPARSALPVLDGAGRVAFAGRPVTELQDKVAGRAGVIGVASRGRRGHDPQSSGPYVKRGDRDDTVPVPMEQKRIGADAAPGLYVDPDGVEWYKPARRR